MKQDRLDLGPSEEGDDVLGAAFRAVREVHDGTRTNEEADATLHRALFRARSGVRRQRLARWIVLPAAAVLVASTAWAGVTGRLAPAVRAVLEVVHAEQPHERPAGPVAAAATSAAPPASVAAVVPSPEVPPPTAAESPPEVAPTPPPAEPAPSPVPPSSVAITAPSRIVTPKASAGATKPSVTAAAPASSSSPAAGGSPSPAASPSPEAPPPPAASADPHAALFAEAHRIHFAERDPGRALAAWDRYLAVEPNGRLAPEARYNRALALVRVGRRSEAQQELAAFANGMYGSYRREEAKALLEALGRDAAAHP